MPSSVQLLRSENLSHVAGVRTYLGSSRRRLPVTVLAFSRENHERRFRSQVGLIR